MSKTKLTDQQIESLAKNALPYVISFEQSWIKFKPGFDFTLVGNLSKKENEAFRSKLKELFELTQTRN